MELMPFAPGVQTVIKSFVLALMCGARAVSGKKTSKCSFLHAILERKQKNPLLQTKLS